MASPPYDAFTVGRADGSVYGFCQAGHPRAAGVIVLRPDNPDGKGGRYAALVCPTCRVACDYDGSS